MKIKLRHNKDIVCPYKDGITCIHPRCIRMRRQECKYYHNNESTLRAQITVIIAPRRTDKTCTLCKNKNKYLRRMSYGKN